MDARDFIGGEGSYLNAKTVESKDLEMKTLTISEVEKQEYDDSNKLVLSFEEIGDKMSLNKTNTKTLIAQYGAETDDWRHKKICLVNIPNAYQGQPGIRIKFPKEGGQ